jgi:diguanylate cyclase (GGDEF)-like protein
MDQNETTRKPSAEDGGETTGGSRVESIMTTEVEFVAPDRSFPDVVAKMRDRRLSCLLVCENRKPVGIISERDLVRVLNRVLENGANTPRTAFDVMSSPLLTIGASESVAAAMALARARGFRRLPIVDTDGFLVGLVTQSDFLKARVDTIEVQRDAPERVVAERTRQLEAAVQRLEALSLQDVLLGIGNRRAMELALDREHALARRHGRAYSVVLFDVDHFKAFNDLYGHPSGDATLHEIASCLSKSARTSDSLYRYGGEEILMLLPETRFEGAWQAAERARIAVEHLAIAHGGCAFGIVTVSAGVGSSGDAFPMDWHLVVEQADAALYRAKREGRNRVGFDAA